MNSTRIAAVAALLLALFALWVASPGGIAVAQEGKPAGKSAEGKSVEGKSSADEPADSARPAAKFDLKKAQVLYLKNCVSCHKADGTGGVKPVARGNRAPNFRTAEFWEDRRDAELIKVIEEGIANSGMVSMKNLLSRQEMADIVTYMRKKFEPARKRSGEGEALESEPTEPLTEVKESKKKDE